MFFSLHSTTHYTQLTQLPPKILRRFFYTQLIKICFYFGKTHLETTPTSVLYSKSMAFGITQSQPRNHTTTTTTT